MGDKNNEKSFEERLYSLKKGCYIFGIIEILAFLINVYSLISLEKIIPSFFNVVISGLMIADIYFMYKYTSELNPKGPTCEKIFGSLMILEGAAYLCVSLGGILIGIILVILGLGIVNESKYFKEYIDGNINTDNNIDDENTDL